MWSPFEKDKYSQLSVKKLLQGSANYLKKNDSLDNEFLLKLLQAQTELISNNRVDTIVDTTSEEDFLLNLLDNEISKNSSVVQYDNIDLSHNLSCIDKVPET